MPIKVDDSDVDIELSVLQDEGIRMPTENYMMVKSNYELDLIKDSLREPSLDLEPEL